MAFEKPNWRNWLRPKEAATLAALDEKRAGISRERKLIRDRCYSRSRQWDRKHREATQ